MNNLSPLLLTFPIFILGIFFIVFLLVELILSRKRAPFIPSSKKAIQKILELVPLPEQGLVLDLGSGDGRFLRAVKQKYPQLQVLGYEISPLALVIHKLLNLFLTKVPVKANDFFFANVSQINVIFCFLLPTDMRRLEQKLQTELPKNAIIISNTFSFKNWLPIQEYKTQITGLAGHIRVYMVK